MLLILHENQYMCIDTARLMMMIKMMMILDINNNKISRQEKERHIACSLYIHTIVRHQQSSGQSQRILLSNRIYNNIYYIIIIDSTIACY